MKGLCPVLYCLCNRDKAQLWACSSRELHPLQKLSNVTASLNAKVMRGGNAMLYWECALMNGMPSLKREE